MRLELVVARATRPSAAVLLAAEVRNGVEEELSTETEHLDDDAIILKISWVFCTSGGSIKGKENATEDV